MIAVVFAILNTYTTNNKEKLVLFRETLKIDFYNRLRIATMFENRKIVKWKLAAILSGFRDLAHLGGRRGGQKMKCANPPGNIINTSDAK